LSKLQQELRYSNNQKLKIEIALTNLVGLEKSATLSEIITGLETGTVEIKSSDSNISKEKSTLEYPTKQITSEKKTPVRTERKIESPKVEAFVPPIKETLSGIQSDLNFDGVNLQLESSDPNTESSLLLHQEYIDKKSRDFFGKKISLRFGSGSKPQAQAKSDKSQKTVKSSQNLDPYEKIIIEDLGGLEIN
jgi:DNA polymerase-3 subunit gamma/tau